MNDVPISVGLGYEIAEGFLPALVINAVVFLAVCGAWYLWHKRGVA